MSDVGEIVGRLRIDAGNWYAELERAQAAARELGTIDPEIEVSAVTAGALKQLEAVQDQAEQVARQNPTVEADADTADALTALRQVERAADTLDGDTATVDVDADTADAEAKLQQLRAFLASVSGDAGKVRVTADTATAEAALQALSARADELGAKRPTVQVNADTGRAIIELNTVAAAAERVGRANPRVKVEVDGAGRAAAELGLVEAAERAVDRSAIDTARSVAGVSGAARQQADTMAYLVRALLTVAPALVPVAAGAVAVTGALTGVGAAGVFAVTGLVRSAKEGGQAWLGYSDTVFKARDSLYQLQDIASQNLLQGVQTGVDELEQAMPRLSTNTAFFAQSLGRITGTGLQAVLTMFERMQPLLEQGAGYLEHFMSSLNGFSTSSGFGQFLQYAQQSMPQVVTFLDNLVVAAGRLLAAFAPIGSVTLGTLNGLLSAINSLPIETLQLLAAGATGVYTAFMAWRAIQGVIAGVNMAMAALSGPVGIVVTAVGLAVGAFAMMQSQAQDTSVAVTNYTAALQASNGAMDETVRRSVALQLQQQGLFDDASKFGVSARQLTDAVLGQGNAYDEVGSKIVTTRDRYGELAQSGGQALAKSLEMSDAGGRLKAALDGQSGALGEASRNAKQMADATGTASAAAGTAGTAFGAEATAAAALSGALNLAKSATMQLESTANGATIAIGGMAKALAESAKAASDHKVSLDQDTVAGAQNREQIAGAVSAVIKHTQAMRDSGAGAQAATAYTQSHITSLVNQATAAGASRTQVVGLVSELLQVPKETITRFMAVDEATPKAEKAAATAKAFSVAKYAAVLEANGVPADTAIAAAMTAGAKWQASHPKAIIDADPAPAKGSIQDAERTATNYARARYEATLSGNPTPANTATASARAAATAFAKDYLATLKGDPAPANAASAGATAQARAFASGNYTGLIRGDNGSALAAIAEARARLAGLNGATATVYVNAVTQSKVPSSVSAALIGSGRAMGGTIGMPPGLAGGGTAVDYVRALPGAAGGISAGSVYGPGSAASDTAGLFRLANGEEVTSNLFGQAARFRPVLKAINSQQVRTPEQLGQALGGGAQEVHVYIHGDDSVLAQAMTVEVRKGIQQQSAAAMRTVTGGWQRKGLLAGIGT